MLAITITPDIFNKGVILDHSLKHFSSQEATRQTEVMDNLRFSVLIPSII